jgi:cytochrome oxidase Cu insertion factor (SCO1/SenC/PrrC family)
MRILIRFGPILLLLLLVLLGAGLYLSSQARDPLAHVPADAHGDFAEIGLPVGIVAPEIEGEDIDGTRFRLSEFRGKVVVLDCWVDR